jgi:hypothetical protein
VVFEAGPLVVFEVLNLAFVFAGGFEGVEGAEVFAFVGLGIYFPGIDAVLSGF